MKLFVYRFGKCSLDRPAFAESLQQCHLENAPLFSPRGHRPCHPIEGQHSIVAAITSLLFTGGPSAVSWLIVAVVVDAIKTVLQRWPWPHVRQKVFELSPAFARDNATSPVTRVRMVAYGKTAPKHGLPRSVLWRPAHAVRCATGDGAISGVASTGNSAPGAKFRSRHDTSCATHALTMPHGSMLFVFPGIAHDGQASEYLPRQIFHAGRNHDRITFSHDSTFLLNVVRVARQHQLSGYSSLYTMHLAV